MRICTSCGEDWPCTTMTAYGEPVDTGAIDPCPICGHENSPESGKHDPAYHVARAYHVKRVLTPANESDTLGPWTATK